MSDTATRSFSEVRAVFGHLFWEYDPNLISWEKDRDLIIFKILSVGDWDAVSWLWKNLPAHELKEWLIKREGRGIDARRLRFWELALHIPHDLVTQWINAPGREVWENRVCP